MAKTFKNLLHINHCQKLSELLN